MSKVVKAQNLAWEEVTHTNMKHETLVLNMEDLKVKVTETSKLVTFLEVSPTDRVAATEEVIDQYDTLLSSSGLMPPNEGEPAVEPSVASLDLQQIVTED